MNGNNSMSMEFREFYGISEPKKVDEDPCDINSSCFDAKLLFNQASRTLSIHQLVDQERSLVADIMSLDNDMHTLVYDNYSKFLGASDVVRTFGNKIDTLTSQASDLQKNLSSISERNDKICDDLKENRQRIQRLIGIQRLLERVKFISQLPEKLQMCLQTKNYKVSIDIWSKVEKILRTQQHFPSFARIYKECTEIMKKIEEKISEEMLTTDINVSDSILYGTLLFRMGVSLPLICSQLVHHRFLVIDNCIEELPELPEEPFSALSGLNERVINDSIMFINLYKEKLISLEKEESNKKKELGILSNFTSNLFSRLQPILPLDSLYSIDCKKLAAYLKLFDDLFTPLSSKDIVEKQIHNIIRKYTISRVKGILEECKSVIKDNETKDIVTIFKARFTALFDQIISEYNILSMLDHKECTQILFHNIYSMFKQLAKDFQVFEAFKCLDVAIITDFLANEGVSYVFKQFSRISIDVPISELVLEMGKDFSAATESCIIKYIKYERFRFDEMVISGINEELSVEADMPERGSQTVVDFVEELNKLWESLCYEIDGESASNELTNTMAFRSSPAPSFVGIRDQGFNSIDRLFTSANRLGLGKCPKLEKSGIFTSVVFYSLKTVLEVLRMNIISVEYFNQVQVDCYLVYEGIKDKIKYADLFSTLIEEIINTASDRTVDPIPLELSEIQKILSE